MTETRKRVRKAVLPVAGLGTRFLPATKAMPKEMLPVVDKPLIQYAVEECIASGIENIIFVTGRRKNAIEDHFDSAPELERFLEDRGSRSKRAWCAKLAAGFISATRARAKRWGSGTPCCAAREFVGDEPFAVLLGDVIMDGPVPATRSLVEIYEATGIGAIAVEEVPRSQVHLYGIIDASPAVETQMGDLRCCVSRTLWKNRGGKSAIEFERHGPLRFAA